MLPKVLRKIIIYNWLFLVFFCQFTYSQNDPFFQNNTNAQISGNLELNTNFFFRDSLIGAANTPQYDRQLYSADSWLNLGYSNWGFNFGLRFDLFNNSNLLNPMGSFNGQGIGRWFIDTKIDQLGISVGYLYDQIGSGFIFRAYEERPLAIDNALYGIRLTYDLGEDWKIKGFTGKQKRQFDSYDPVVKGINLEGFLSVKTTKNKLWSLAPGLGIVNRTLDDVSMNSIVSTINTYSIEDAFVPKYNVYGFSLYNTLSYGNFTWYFEGAYKTEDAINDPFGTFTIDSTTFIGDKFVSKPGYAIYSSLSFATKGVSLTLEGKRTDHFALRIRPQEVLNQGILSFQPAMSRINTYRLTARYNSAPQELGETAFQVDLKLSPDKDLKLNFNYANIQNLNGEMLYGELNAEATYKYERQWVLLGGLQMQTYNQEVYEFKPGVPNVTTITPFADFLYKITRKKAIRFEAQYMNVGKDNLAEAKQDYGDWLFGLVEFSMAPHWTFTASDMYNINPGKNAPEDQNGEKKALHFPRFDIYYSNKSNRFSLSYVKQVEGIVCAGGICRLEPAFSGLKFTVNSSF